MRDFLLRTDLLVRVVEGETVILDREADLIHTLNPTASFIWDALQRKMSVQDIVKSLVESFEVDSAMATADVNAVLNSFRDLRLFQSN